MNKPLLIGGVTAALVAAIWYYRNRVSQIATAQQSPEASTDNSLAAMVNSYAQDPITGQVSFPYARMTGQTGDAVTSNYRYSTYLSYLNQGGTNSGESFDQYLTASQTQALPSS